MPLYDYECTACKHTWDQEQRITEAPIEKCPQCDEPRARRLISSSIGFQLQGRGWAKDGYGNWPKT